MNKRYCKNCTWHTNVEYGAYCDYRDGCYADNTRDYIGRKNHVFCGNKNGNCDCKQYKRKWWKFWVKEE